MKLCTTDLVHSGCTDGIPYNVAQASYTVITNYDTKNPNYRNDSPQRPAESRSFTFGTSREGAYSRQGAYLGQGTFLFER